jgi:hypothetical protein
VSVAISRVEARSSAWRHHHQIGDPAELDMTHLGLVGQVEQVVIGFLARQRGHGQGGHELRCRTGQHRRHRAARLADQPDQLQALVGGDAAADDQQYPFSLHQGFSI